MCIDHRIIYIDTSAVLRLGSGLTSKLYFSHLFTSCLTVMELASRVTDSEEEYKKRRALIKLLYDHKLVHFHTLPDYRIFDSFAALPKYGELKRPYDEHLDAVVKLILSCETLTGFNEQLLEQALSESHKKIIWYDDHLGKNFANITTEMIRTLKEDYDKNGITPALQALYSLPESATFKQLLQALRDHPNESSGGLSLFAMAQRAVQALGKNENKKEDVEEIFTSYNNSITPFLRALGYQSFTPAIEGRTSAKNDGIDVGHFVYVCKSCHLLSHDDDQKSVAIAVGLGLWSSE